LNLPDGDPLALVSTESKLPDLADSFKAYEDVAAVHREIMAALAAEGLKVRYILLLGARHAQLVDGVDEETLLDAPSQADIDVRLAPLLDLQGGAHGAGSGFPRKAPRQCARELAAWTEVWKTRLGGSLKVGQEAMGRLFEWILLARAAEFHNLPESPRRRFSDVASARIPDPAKFLEDRFRELQDRWFLLQESSWKSQASLVAEAGRTTGLRDCLASLSLLTRRKFTSAVFAEAFSDDDLRHVSWKTAITADPADARDDDIPLWPDEPETFPLDVRGMGVLLQTFDGLVEKTRRFALEHAVAVERGERPGVQMDLLGGPVDEIHPDDAIAHVLRRLLAVSTQDASRGRAARLALLARACEWRSRLGLPNFVFPRVRIVVEQGGRTGGPVGGASLHN